MMSLSASEPASLNPKHRPAPMRRRLGFPRNPQAPRRKGRLHSLLPCVAFLPSQLWVFEGFLPYDWPHPINHLYERVFPTPKYDPHPNMAWEFELDFRQHPWHRVLADALLILQSAVYFSLILMIVRALRRRPS